MTAKFDIIGDIHGHAEALHELLHKLGYQYRAQQGAFIHPEQRQALFLGDLIDRGPQQLEVLHTVKSMVDAGSAHSVMGNHELNAIGWTIYDAQGQALRPHTEQNRYQHAAFLDAVGEGSKAHRFWVDWFLGLPIYIQTPQLQMIHACWSPNDIGIIQPYLTQFGQVQPRQIHHVFQKGHAPYKAIENLLKGPEYKLPPPYSFQDINGHLRHEARLKWWQSSGTLAEAALLPSQVAAQLPTICLNEVLAPYTAVDRPTFVGHYWFNGTPQPLTPQVACLDYSIAKDGQLVAYRFDGESALDKSKFIAV